jgi:type I restriction enzyme R subunit
LAHKIRSLAPDVDITDVQGKVEDLLDGAIATKGYVIKPLVDAKIDLSKIDFDAIKKKFVKDHKHIETEKLKGIISQKLTAMLRLNKSRLSFLEKYQEILNEYNSGSINVEDFFNRLMAFAKGLNEEDKRAMAEHLTEEELAIFDLLYKPKLTKKDADKVKSVAHQLLDKLKREKLVLDWRKRQQTRADVLLTIQDILDEGLPDSYTKPEYEEKCSLVYQHVYDSYYGSGKSMYVEVN